MSESVKVSDGSVWPRPSLESDDELGIGWRLIHGGELTQAERFEAASIVQAYGHLVVQSTQAKRDRVCREIREALNNE